MEEKAFSNSGWAMSISVLYFLSVSTTGTLQFYILIFIFLSGLVIAAFRLLLLTIVCLVGCIALIYLAYTGIEFAAIDYVFSGALAFFSGSSVYYGLKLKAEEKSTVAPNNSSQNG